MLSKIFLPSSEFNLIRVGRNNDGGYLVCPESIEKSDFLISMGISTDWSFEKDFIKIHRVPIHSYDHTVNISFFLKHIFFSFVRFMMLRSSIFELLDNIKLVFDYRKFFRNDIVHNEIMIGYDVGGSISLSEAMSRVDKNSKIFLKIDIEGAEYRILDQLVDLSYRLTSVVIEFHDVDLHHKKIEDFIRDFDLPIVHVHQNNCTGFDENNDPLVIEVTFSKYNSVKADEPSIPNVLDQPNSLESTDYPLQFDFNSNN